MPTRQDSRAVVAARRALVVAYAVAIATCCLHDDAPCLLWTVAMPLLPIAVVVLGFHTWRRICPLAAVARIGGRVGRQRRAAPAWVDRWALLIAFIALFLGLVGRHLGFNGDAHWLASGLVGVAAVAIVVNALASGKAWCNLVCPVGVVERVYTDGAPPGDGARCTSCTGCKSRCPDIDQARAYRSDIGGPALRTVTFALPGLVVGFYGYFALRFGEWAAFFDGRWTTLELDHALVLGPGFTFAPSVPALVACPLSLIASASLSLLAFHLCERIASRRTEDPLRLRHRLLTLASFCAFNLFYLFAGQPTLLHFPILGRVGAFVVPVVATLALARRWRTVPVTPTRRRLPVVE